MSKNVTSKADSAPSASKTSGAPNLATNAGSNASPGRPGIFQLFLALLPWFLLAAVFLPSANPDVRFSYRDVAYYYYPLFEQIQRSWESGRIPLWNPYVNLGQPLAGDPTSSVFYPGKAIFFLSSLGLCSYSLCFKLYLWLHVAFAFLTCRSLARNVGISRVGSTLSGIAYAFSGQILFQYTNVIYLVGAAWTPLLFLFARQYFIATNNRSRLRAIIFLSASSAATILGGEPQIVYLTFLCSIVAGFCIHPTSKKYESKEPDSATSALRSSHAFRRITKVGVFALTAAPITFAFSAVQVLPSMELISRSTRAGDELPRSLWDVPKACAIAHERGENGVLCRRDFYEGILCGDIDRQGRNSSVYRFSVGPWRWLEYLIPNVGGRQYPQSARWFEIFPEELALWTPTLYFGVVPLLLALAAARLRKRSDTPEFAVAASWLVLFGLFGALGGYGLVWCVRFLTATFAGVRPSQVFTNGDPVGGLYWLLNLLAPKFVEFRYPAKLLTLSALGFSVLTGIGWDHKRFTRALQRLIIAAITLTSLILFCTVWIGPDLVKELSIPANPLFGPFQESIARKTVVHSCAQTTLVLFLAGILLARLRHAELAGRRVKRQNALTAALLLLVAVDLFVANRQLVVVSPSVVFTPSKERVDVNADLLANQNRNAEADAVPPARVYRYPIWFPPLFQQESSTRRIEERVLWDVNTLYPMYPTQNNVALLDVRGAVMESAFARFIDTAVGRTNLDGDLAFLDVQYVLGPKFWIDRISPSEQSEEPDDSASSVPDWRVAFKKVSAVPTRAALLRNGKRVDFAGNDRLVCLAYEPNRISFLIDVSQDAELIVADQYWPDWEASILPVDDNLCRRLLDAQYCGQQVNSLIKTASGKARKNKRNPIRRTETESAFEFLRKINVRNGRYCVTLKYSPRKLRLGAAVSAAAWTALVLGYGSLWLRRRRSRLRQALR